MQDISLSVPVQVVRSFRGSPERTARTASAGIRFG